MFKRIVSRLRAGAGGERGGVSIVAPESVKRRIAEAEAALRRVKVPGYDVDVISSGVVVKFRVSMDGERIIVFVDYSGSNPGCSFCRFLNDTLWRRILAGIREALESSGFKEVYIIDWARGSPVVTL